jgi:hypothetical protein
MADIFRKPDPENSLFNAAQQMMPTAVPTSFEQWKANPENLIKIGQQPEQAQPAAAPQPSVNAPQAPQTAYGDPADANPAPVPQPAQSIMPNRPQLQHLSRGQNIGMALATLADSIGSSLTHTPATVGPNRLNTISNIQQQQRDYDQNQPKLAYDLNQQQTRNTLGNEATAASTAHTRQETAKLKQETEGGMSPLAQRRSAWLQSVQKAWESGQYSPEILKSRAMMDAGIQNIPGVVPEDIDNITKNTIANPPKFEFKNGAVEPITYRGQSYGPTPVQGEPPEVTTARQQAQNSLTQSIQTDKEKNKNKVQVNIQAQMGDPNSPEHQALVGAVANHDMTFTSAFPRMAAGPVREHLVSEIKALNPDWKESDYDVAKKSREDMTSGPMSKSLLAIATVRQHAPVFKDLADKLANGDVQAANQIGNAFGLQFGSDKASNFNIAKQAFGGEVGKALDGAGVTEGERKQAADAFSAAMSPAQFKGAIDTVDKLMEGKQRAAKQTADLAQKQGQGNFGQGGAAHVISVDGKNYKYKGSGDTADIKNYTEIKK